MISAIAGSILGNAVDSWFSETKLGIWFYGKVADISGWAAMCSFSCFCWALWREKSAMIPPQRGAGAFWRMIFACGCSWVGGCRCSLNSRREGLCCSRRCWPVWVSASLRLAITIGARGFGWAPRLRRS